MSNNTRKYSPFPKTLAACVEPLTRPLFKAQASAVSRLLTEWHAIVGPALSRHSMPEKLSFPGSKQAGGKKTGGTLTISVENGFATELQHMQPVILERLAAYFGYAAIARIAISHTFPTSGVALRSSKSEARAKTDACLSPDCSRMADTVDDSELKEALQSLAKTLSGQYT